MTEIKVQKIPQKSPSAKDFEDLIARFCLFFPSYTFAQARRLPAMRIIQMLKVARREEARRMIELTQVIASPHAKGGKGPTKVIEYYQRVLRGEEE